jgi:hypothetical protein
MYDTLECAVLTGGNTMRSRLTRWSLIALSLVLMGGSASYAAITEKYCLDGINDTIAVMRYFHRLATDAQYNLDLCRAAKALTQKQLTVEQSLYDDAANRGRTDVTAYLKSLLDNATSKGNTDEAAYLKTLLDGAKGKELMEWAASLKKSDLDDATKKKLTDRVEYLNTVLVMLDHAIFFSKRVTRLNHQLARLDAFKYEHEYDKRITDSHEQIARLEADLAANVSEYEALFHKKAQVQTSFEEEMAKYRPHRENMAYFLVLDHD